MIVLFGPLISGARGKVGGLIFSANQGGPYVRQWSRPANPRSEGQVTTRNRFGRFANNWADLSAAERTDWDDYADDPAQELTNSLGENYFISGFNWYVRINSHLIEAEDAERDDAPTLTRPVAPTIDNIRIRPTGDVANSRVRYDTGSAGAGEKMLITARLFSSVGRERASHRFTHMIIADTPTLPGNIAFQGPIEAAFGTIIIDQKCFVETAIQDSHGQRGPVDTDNRAVEAS